MKKLLMILTMIFTTCISAVTMTGCDLFSPGSSHTHEYSTEYSYDANYHWFECDCGEDKGKTAHVINNHACICGYQEHVHVFDREMIQEIYKERSATCTEKARYYYSCSCGAKGDQTFEAGVELGHDYSIYASNADGTHTKTCSRDNSHTVIENCSGGTATCTEKAICSVCNGEYGQLQEHTYAQLNYNETEHWHECACGDKMGIEGHNGGTATCTEKAECSVCGEEYGQLQEHAYEEEVTNPTCTAQGYTTYTCSCGDSYVDDYVDELGHTEVIDVAVAPTCTATGLTEGKHCSVCGDTTVAQEIVEELGHSYESVATDPTCTEQGYTTHTCSVCGDSYVDSYVEELGHTEVIDAAVPPTCTETGLTEGKHCSVCGETLIAQEIVDELGHSYESVVIPPTCTEQGYTTHTCSVCGDSYVDSYVEAGHKYESVVTNPTCTEQGYTTHTCSACGDSYVDDYVDELGHTEVIDAAVPPTCTATGLTEGKHCSVCNEVLIAQEVVDALGHTYESVVTPPTCTEQGYTTYSCSVCSYSYVTEYVSARHNYEAVVTEPTCTAQGYTTHTCSVCGDSYVDNYVDKLDHNYEAVVTDPTCSAQGYTTYICVCGDSYVDNFVGALGHDYSAGYSVNTEGTHYKHCIRDNNHKITEACFGGTATCTEKAVCDACGQGYGEFARCNFVDGICPDCGQDYYTEGLSFELINGGTAYRAGSGNAYGDLIFPSNYRGKPVTTIAQHGFWRSGVTSIKLGDNVTIVERNAFVECSDLRKIFINQKVSSMGFWATYGCRNLTIYCEMESQPAGWDPDWNEGDRVTGYQPKVIWGATYQQFLCEHSFSDYVYNEDATCTRDGTKTAYCDNGCGLTDTVTASDTKLGHSFTNYIYNQDATCTKDGTETALCNNGCGEQHTRTKTGSKLDHSYNEVVTGPTCTEQGYTTYTCSVCGDTYVGDYVDGGHDYETVITPPTCTEQGYTIYTCSICGDSYVDDYVPAVDHSYNEVVTDPTCTEQGYTTYTCSGCDDSYVGDYVDALGHSLDANGDFCTVCGELIHEGQIYDSSEFIIEKSTGKVYKANANNELVAYDATSYLGEETVVTIAGIEQTLANTTAFAFETASLENLTEGENYIITAGQNNLIAKVVTKVLATLEDFFVDADASGAVEAAEMTRDNYIFNLMPLSASGAANPRIAIKGYYVLANNIDLKSNGNLCNRSMNADGTNGSGDHTVQIFDGSQDVGFRGTLDGRGFALKNINANGSSAGMFGAFYGATVKNIAFDGATNSAGNGSGLVLGYSYNSTFENVYIRLVGNNGGDTWAGEGSWNALAIADNHGGSTFNNLVVESMDGLLENRKNVHQRFAFTRSTTAGTFTNTAIVGMPVTYRCAASTTDASKKAIQVTISKDAMTAFDVTAGEVQLSALPEAVLNAYGNLIANIEARAKVTGIDYINFIEDTKDRNYYLDGANLVADTAVANTFVETGFWKVIGGKLVWTSLVEGEHEHKYESVVTSPTCTEQGYTTYTCSGCDDSYVGDYVDALGHTSNPDGYCNICGEFLGEVEVYESGEFVIDKATGKVLKANANNELVAYDATSYLGEETTVAVGGVQQTIVNKTEFAFETASLETLTEGENYIISAGQNNLIAQVVTKVFFNVNDFFTDLNSDGAITDDEKVQTNNFFNVATGGTADKKVTGYYVLANNIDATGAPLKANNTPATISNTSADFGFQGTLDGRGFALSNLNVFNGAGLFGLIKNATIKDIAIRNLSNSRDDSNRPLVANAIIDSTLENVYITVAEYWLGWNQKYKTTSNAIGGITNSTLTNVIFENNAWKSDKANIQKSENSWYGFGAASTTANYINVNVVGAPITVGYKVHVAATDTETAKYKLVLTLPIATIQKYVAGAGVYALADCGGAETDYAKLIAGIEKGETSGTASLTDMDIQYIEFVAETSTRGYFYDYAALVANTAVADAYIATGFWKIDGGELVWASLNNNEHNYVAVITLPTCTERGYTTYTCSICGDSYVGNYVEGGHNYESVVTPPTCTEQGYTAYICSACGDNYVGNYVPALDHSYNEVVTPPTCIEEGYITYTCSVCGDSYIGDYTEGSHSYESVVTSPTCTEQGYTTYACTACGDSYVDDYVDALGHSYDQNWKCIVCGEEVGTEGLQYTLINNDTEYEVSGYTGSSADVVIPSTYNDKPVTSIGEVAFDSCVPLETIKIADNVKKIGVLAFEYCPNLTSVIIGDGVMTIEDRAFAWCYSLTSITVGDNNEYFKDIDGNLYTKDGKVLIQYVIGKTETTFNMPKGVTKIENYAFTSCTSLEAIEASSSLTEIGEWAFYNCTSLKTIVMPDSVTTIGYGAFSSCYSLDIETIGKGVTTIDYFAFYNCTSLTSIIIPASVTAMGSDVFYGCDLLETIYCEAESQPSGWDSDWKGDCSANVVWGYQEDGHTYESVVTPPTCTEQGYTTHTCLICGRSYVDNYVPTIDHNYNEVVTPPTCTEQGYTTYTCSVCGDSYVGNYVPTIDHSYNEVVTKPTCTEQGYTTYTCSACGHSYVDNYVGALGHIEVIDEAVAPTCTTTGLTEGKHCSVCGEIIIAQEIANALGHNYVDCVNNGNETHTKTCAIDSTHILTEACNGGKATCEEKATCKDCNNLYGEYADHLFDSLGYCYYCDIYACIIPDGRTTIYSGEFVCHPMQLLIIPASVTIIESDAFDDCDNLIEVIYLGTIDQWVEIDFANRDANPLWDGEELYINGELVTEVNITTATKINANAFCGYDALTSVTIGKNVTSIGDYAFYNCTSLTTIYCEAESQPAGWDSGWKGNCEAEVIWGYNGEIEEVETLITLDKGLQGIQVNGLTQTTITATNGQEVILPKLECWGYKFLGWKNLTTGELIEKADGEYKFVHDGSNVTYKATWQKVSYDSDII